MTTWFWDSPQQGWLVRKMQQMHNSGITSVIDGNIIRVVLSQQKQRGKMVHGKKFLVDQAVCPTWENHVLCALTWGQAQKRQKLWRVRMSRKKAETLKKISTLAALLCTARNISGGKLIFYVSSSWGWVIFRQQDKKHSVSLSTKQRAGFEKGIPFSRTPRTQKRSHDLAKFSQKKLIGSVKWS